MRRCRSVVVCGLSVILVVSSAGCGAKPESDREAEQYFELLIGATRLIACAMTDDCVEPEKSLVASGGQSLFIPATAHVSGVLGTDWRSDVELHNVSDETASVTIRLLIHRNVNSSSPTRTMSIGSGESLRLADILASEFGREGSAALLISVESGRLVATSRTFNLLAAGNPLGLPDGSTFGQAIPALPMGRAIQAGEEGRLIQLSHSTATDGGFRTNLGVVNATGADIDVAVDLYDSYGTHMGLVPVSLGPYGYRQLNQVFGMVTIGDVDFGYAVVSTASPGGAFFAYASVVDNLTGDPIAIPALIVPELEPAGVGAPSWVVAAAHAGGAGGTNWRTDLEVHNWGDDFARYTIEVLEHGADNTEPESRNFLLAAGESERFEDILMSEFGFNGGAALRIRPTEGHVVVTSRTFNLLGAGNAMGLPAGSTFGQYIAGVDETEAIHFGEEGRIIQLSNTPGEASGFRTNLVLVNASLLTIDVEVDLHQADGALLGTETRRLDPREYRQVNRVFEEVTNQEIADGYAVVRTTTEGGAFFALGSVVDNLTGDPVGISAVRVNSLVTDVAVGQLESALDVFGRSSIEDTVNGIQLVGVDGVLDRFVTVWPDSVTTSPSGMVVDFGGGTVVDDGTVWSGKTTVDTSGLTTTPTTVSGTMVVTVDDLRAHDLPVGSSTTWTFDLVERQDGTVVGEISAEPEAGPSADGTVSGTIVIDSAICEKYPIAGSLTFVAGGQVTTIAPSPECDGTLVPDVFVMPPGYDFVFTSDDPWDPRSNAFITSTSNAEVGTEGNLGGGYWRPMVGAETFEATTPGVITFHYGFDRPIAGGELLLTVATFHWAYSRGHAFIDGSTDGVNWQPLVEVEPPDFGQGRGGGLSGALPPMFVGARDIWLRVRLYSWGQDAHRGGIYCNTAQMFRYDPRQTTNTFELMVDLED
jgi:hypothetical protein